MMAGGSLKSGRVDNTILHDYRQLYDPFFQIFLQFRKGWSAQIGWFQRISQERSIDQPLHVQGSMVQKGDHGSRITADPLLLQSLDDFRMIHDLSISDDQVSFSFADENIRNWLRDVGSALELYAYEGCLKAECFDDVVSSAVVDWDEASGGERVSNEIDVMATKGVIPLFISCKATEIKTEALNELAILRDRFGGKMAKAAIISTSPVRAAARHRAEQLQISVIDLKTLQDHMLPERLKAIIASSDMI